MTKYAIWDIDNCLSNDHHRLHAIDWTKEGDARYEAYNSGMLLDKPAHVSSFEVMRAIGCTPVFFTGRPERFRVLTEWWLHRNFAISSPRMHMRPNGTLGVSPAALKRQMLRDFLQTASKDDIVAAFDDLPAVIEMYRSEGIVAVQLAVGDPSAAYAPADLATVN